MVIYRIKASQNLRDSIFKYNLFSIFILEISNVYLQIPKLMEKLGSVKGCGSALKC